jgi:hypothetical protein
VCFDRFLTLTLLYFLRFFITFSGDYDDDAVMTYGLPAAPRSSDFTLRRAIGTLVGLAPVGSRPNPPAVDRVLIAGIVTTTVGVITLGIFRCNQARYYQV